MSLQRNLSVPRMMEDKISWAEMATEDYYPEIPLSQWQPCHFTYLSHYYFDNQQSVPQILARMFSKPKTQRYLYIPANDQIKGHKVELIHSYFDLMTITQDLNVCTAVRKDLVDGFLSGTHLRWKITNEDGMTVGVIGFLHQSRNFDRIKLFKGLNFEIYALGKNHSELGKLDSTEAQVFHNFIERHGLKIVQSFIPQE